MRFSRLALSLGLLLSAASGSRADFLVVRVITNPDATSRGNPSLANGLGGPLSPPTGGMIGSPSYPIGGMLGMAGAGMMGSSSRPPTGGMIGSPSLPIGGPPGMGMVGMGTIGNPNPGQGQMGGGTNNPPPPLTVKLRHDDYVIAVIPIKKSYTVRANGDVWIAHQWTKGGDISAKIFKNADILTSQIRLPVPKRLYAMHMAKTVEAQRGVNWYHQTASWCLEHGLTEECEKALDMVVKLVADGKGGTPEAITKASAAAWVKIKDEINLDSPKVDLVKDWKERAGLPSSKTSLHYAILYDGNNELFEESVKRRLGYLEQNFRTFYMLNVLQGRALKLPEQKQVAVVSRDIDAFGEQRISSDSTEMLTADGFFAQRDNVIFFSPRRTDEAWLNFSKITRSVFDKYGYSLLLSGKPIGDTRKRYDDTAKEEIFRGQMYAMVQQALEEEAELAAATQEGTRQLYIASGLLPKAVYLPGWLKFGLAAQQEVTKAPFPTDTQAKVGFWPSSGGASWSWMRYFEDIKTTRRVGVPLQALTDTLAGKSFDDAALGIEPSPVIKRVEKGKVEDEAWTKKSARYAAEARAKTLSWALVWYLTRNYPAELYTFFGELSALPRDLEPDEGVLTLMFARSFKLTKASPTGDIPDGALMAKFADEWIRWMTRQNSPTTDLKLEDAAVQGFGESQTPGEGSPMIPGMPGGPGN